jgi:BID domain of Bartonella effector protein (Bep)
VFVARETARDATQVSRQMARGEVRAALAERQKSKTNAASPTPDTSEVRAERDADSAAAYWKRVRTRSDTTRDEDSPRAKVREDLAARSPVTREAPEGPAVAAYPPLQNTGQSGAEDQTAPPPLLPAWRDPMGQGKDSLGRGMSAEDLARVADNDPAVRQEVEARTRTLRVIYRDPAAAADALNALIRKSGDDLRLAAEILRRGGPKVLGELRGREGWLAREAAKVERTYARSAARTIPIGLDQEVRAREMAARRHTTEVEQQQTRDAIEVPGLSRASLAVLENVRAALDATNQQREGERHDAQQRRREEAVAGACTAGRADPVVAGELDRFMAAVEQRLGEDGMRDALRAAGQAGRLNVPGAGPEQRAGLDMLVRSVKLGREGVAETRAWGNRTEREVKRATRERTRQEERLRLALPPETPGDQRRKGLGLGQ